MDILSILLVIVSIAALYFAVRFFLLKQGAADAAKELKEISADLEVNRAVKLASPQKELEHLLQEINHTLDEIRKANVRYQNKEQELLVQIENISHDLRTPLTAILGYLDLIEKSGLSEESRQSIEIVKRKSLQLKKLTADFYDLTRLTAQQFELQEKNVDVCRMLRESVMDSYQSLEEKKLEVILSIPEYPVFVKGDEGAFSRIFLNLMQNAGRYACHQLRILLSVETNWVIITLENDTKQVETEWADTIFERFFTGQSSRNQGSSGLGLPIVKHLTEEMYGQICADTRTEKGEKWLTITIKFPWHSA